MHLKNVIIAHSEFFQTEQKMLTGTLFYYINDNICCKYIRVIFKLQGHNDGLDRLLVL